MNSIYDDNMDNCKYNNLFDYVKTLATRIDKLEKENEQLKRCSFQNKKKKMDIVESLNESDIKPPIIFRDWVERLDYKKFIDTVFTSDLLTGMIELFEYGVDNISILDYEQLPLRAFNQKQNLFYIFDTEETNNGNKDSNPKWIAFSNNDFDKWFMYIGKRFLIEFKTWFDSHEELIKTDDNMSNKYVEYLQKTLGGQRMTDEGRNQRLKQHVFKSIKQSCKFLE